MLSRTRITILACGWLVVAGTAFGEEPIKPQLIGAPVSDVVRTRTMEWVAGQGVKDPKTLEEIAKLWSFGTESRTAAELFELTIKSFSLADAETQSLVSACQMQPAPLLPPDSKILARDGAGVFYLANISLYYGRYLAHRQMYEEALEVLEKVSLADVADPATLLFFKAVCQHHLLMKDEGLKTLDQLLKHTEGVPVRYTTVANLMQYDFEALHEKSLDEISRKMSDVERRLSLGRTGEKVQKKEAEIVDTLDELIKKIEEQSGGGGGGGGGSGKNNSNESSSPAEDSTVKGQTAPGEVDKKKFKNQGGWGALPPKERAKAKDDLIHNFPAHYMQIINEFSRKQANRPANSRK